jgi:hypothetical protein
MTHAYFELDGGLYHPHKTARSPWSREQQSGLAVAGLLARAIENTPSAEPMRMARLTVDILGAAPMGPTDARAEIIRDGRRMQVVEASLVIGGDLAAKATGLRVADHPGPAAAALVLDYPGPEAAPRTPITPYFDAGHPLETRLVHRATFGQTPGVFWSRFNSQLVAGETASPVVRACMCADIASGPASGGLSRDWRFPNADLSLYFAREPVGDWILGVSRIDVGADGVGLTQSTLADQTGVFGYARQTLVFSRQKAPA